MTYYHNSLASAREEPQMMTAQQVADVMCFSVRTLWRMVEQKKFPQPVRYNRKLVRWRRVDVQQYINSGSIEGGS